MASYDFSDKTVISFNIHEGSGQSGTVNLIKSICTGAEVMNGFSIRGTVAQNDAASARTTVRNWLKANDFQSLIHTQKSVYTVNDLRK
ncbi:MAG: hypothetical protein K2F73_03510 [Ruminococcus sp.]|nr:hypothetical protein [Ruminococcus sp.]